MAKPKNPLLSLGARGTIAKTLTFQKRGRGTIAREKPIPTDPYTLYQAYQRWDYRDYAYQWTLLPNSEKQVYRTRASRYHITGFSQWMKEQLKELPDLAGRWHLDEESGATAYDSSKNNNNGVIVGASPAAGIIDGAYSFDGDHDQIDIPDHPTLQLPSAFTIEALIKASPPPSRTMILQKGAGGTAPWNYAWLLEPDNTALFIVRNAANTANFTQTFGVVADGSWHHLLSTFNTTEMKTFVDGENINTRPTWQEAHTAPGHPFIIGFLWATWYLGLIDEVRIYNRVLDPTEIKRHSERRYPP
ncbi:hypothetical protein ES708_23377 [subsurface metagenome]